MFEIAFTNLPGEECLADYCMPFVVQKYPVERNASPMTPRPYVRLSNEKAFRLFPDPADERRSLWFEDLDGMALLDPSVNQGAAYVKKIRHPLYYESGFEAGEVRAYDNNIIVIRLGGLYLLQAEMCLKAGDRNKAIAALNIVRGRAGAAEAVRQFRMAGSRIQLPVPHTVPPGRYVFSIEVANEGHRYLVDSVFTVILE